MSPSNQSGAGGGGNNLPKFDVNKFSGISSRSNNGMGLAPLQSNNKPGNGPKPKPLEPKLKVGPKYDIASVFGLERAQAYLIA
ncbi:hypothetical protein DL769_000729 [Monosporascus sp. CRB-8-3]|nr:hypothetical protein DL769_000729 [Monosporascus sp. CRB-8-3]